MAFQESNSIIVPSKSIYDVDFSKRNNNKITKVNVSEQRPQIDTYEKKEIKSEDVSNSYKDIYDLRKYESSTNGIRTGGKSANIAHAYLSSYFIKITKDIIIPKTQSLQDKYIDTQKIYAGSYTDIESGETKYNIEYEMTYLVGEINCNISGSFTDYTGSGFVVSGADLIPYGTTTSYTVIKTNELMLSNTNSSHYGTDDVSATITIPNESNIGNTAILTQDENNFYIKGLILQGEHSYFVQNRFAGDIGGTTAAPSSGDFTVKWAGKKISYIPQSIRIKVYADTKEYAFDDIDVSYGVGSQEFLIENNELIQTTNTYTSNGTTKQGMQNIAENILKEYENGKETFEIECSVNDYYYGSWDSANNRIAYELDEYGKPRKAIDISCSQTDKMVFEIGDIVIPMKYTNKGDVPMSQYIDGTARAYRVTGVSYSYNGVVMQKIRGQEISRENLTNSILSANIETYRSMR